MIKEKYSQNLKEISINIVQSKITSVRKKDITKTGFRVYEDGFIGVSGTVGQADEIQLEKRAIENLTLRIPYPYEPTAHLVKKVDNRKEICSNESFVKEVEELLQILREEFPDFILSNNIFIQEIETKLVNNKGLDLSYLDKFIIGTIIVKEKSSVNVFDAFVAYMGRQYVRDDFLKNARKTLIAFKNKVDLPKSGKLPVIFAEHDILPIKKLIEELNGYKVGAGASIFKGELGKKKFHDEFTLYQSAEEEDITGIEFFDAEGVVNEDHRYNLIEHGKIITPYTDKKTSVQFNLPLTGSACGDYDKVPALAPRNLKVKSGDKTLKELLNGELGILVSIASGGDFTQEGAFAAPVQLAFLTDGEKLIGRLPELSISGELYAMFGDDFVGKSKDKELLGEKNLVLNLNVACNK